MTEYKNTIAEALNTNKKDFITEYNQIAYDIEKINQLQLHQKGDIENCLDKILQIQDKETILTEEINS